MALKIFRQSGKDIIINIDNIVSIKADETSGKTIIYSVGQTNEIDMPFEEVKVLLGIGVKKEIRGF
jgi:hypothetical protein